MGWESPITIVEREIQTKLNDDIENAVMMEVQTAISVDINKDELLKALNYSQDSYNKGYAEGHQIADDEYKEKLLNIYTKLLSVFSEDASALKKIDIIFEEPTAEVIQ